MASIVTMAGLALAGCGARTPPPAQIIERPPAAIPVTPPPLAAPNTPVSLPVSQSALPNAADLARIEALVAPGLRTGLSVNAASALAQATERTLETGPSGRAMPWSWNGAGDAMTGTITPQPLRRMPKSAQCRTFVQVVGVKSAELVACKTQTGSGAGIWAIMAQKTKG